MAKQHIGSSVDDFLEEEGLLEGAAAVAVKRCIAFQLARKMAAENLSKAEMARRMATSQQASYPNHMNQKLTICISNEGYEASLEKRKIYVKLEDATAAQHGQVRVVDESGEDYLFPAAYFIDVTLPQETEQAVIAAA